MKKIYEPTSLQIRNWLWNYYFPHHQPGHRFYNRLRSISKLIKTKYIYVCHKESEHHHHHHHRIISRIRREEINGRHNNIFTIEKIL